MSSPASDDSPISVKILRDGDMTVDKDVGAGNPQHFKDFIDKDDTKGLKLKNIVPPWLRGSLDERRPKGAVGL